VVGDLNNRERERERETHTERERERQREERESKEAVGDLNNQLLLHVQSHTLCSYKTV
jgi:hypothetical protein